MEELALNCHNYNEMFKEMLAASSYYGLTCDEYLQNVQDIYQETYSNKIYNLETQLAEKVPNLEVTERLEILKFLLDNFEDNLKLQVDCLEQYLNSAIFRLPNNIVMPNDQKLQEAIENYSKEEDEQLDKDIEKTKSCIHEKRMYINILKERIALFKGYKKALE